MAAGSICSSLPLARSPGRLRYRFDGKEKTLVIGNYPDVSLADARAEREAAKETLKSGRDPNVVKKIEKAIGKQQAAVAPGEGDNRSAPRPHRQRPICAPERQARA